MPNKRKVNRLTLEDIMPAQIEAIHQTDGNRHIQLNSNYLQNLNDMIYATRYDSNLDKLADKYAITAKANSNRPRTDYHKAHSFASANAQYAASQRPGSIVGQMGKNAAYFVPGLGSAMFAADIVNDVTNGNYADAAKNLALGVALGPVLGKVGKGAGKVLSRVDNWMFTSTKRELEKLYKNKSNGLQFIRALSEIPKVGNDGYVKLVPEDNLLGNFSTHKRAVAHHSYSNLEKLPNLLFVDESKLKGIRPLALEPSDSFFLADDVNNIVKPGDVGFWSTNYKSRNVAKFLGFDVKTPNLSTRMLERLDERLYKMLPKYESRLTKGLEIDTRNTNKTLLSTYNKINSKLTAKHKKFEESLYKDVTYDDYIKIREKTNIDPHVVKDNTVDEIKNIYKEYDDALKTESFENLNRLADKYDNKILFTLPDGTELDHGSFIEAIMMDSKSDKLIKNIIKQHNEGRFKNFYYNPTSSIEYDLLSKLGIPPNPKIKDGMIIGTDMSKDDAVSLLNNYIMQNNIKSLKYGGRISLAQQY